MSIKTETAERLRQIKELSATNTILSNDEIVNMPPQYFTEWSDLLAQVTEENPQVLVNMGRIIQHGGNLYRVQQDTYIQEQNVPGAAGMYSIFRLYRTPGVYDWVQGEYAVIGDQRYYSDILYEAYTDPGTNIWEPNVVASIWKVVEEEVTE